MMSRPVAPEQSAYDELANDGIADHIPQQVDTDKLMTDGWQFDVSDREAEVDAGVDTTNKKDYFEALAKLNEDGHSLAEYCQGLGLSDDDGPNAQTPFAVLRESMSDLLGDGGVLKLVRVPGSGPQVTPGSRVCMHYVGQFEGHDEPFDSTYVRHRGRPETHIVGENSRLLLGLNQVVLSMRKGETCLALLAPDYAYGKYGCGPRIPGDVDALFEVTVISFTDSTDADEFDEMTEEQQRSASFPARIRAMRSHHVRGNELYSMNDFFKAAKSYREGIRVFLISMSFQNQEQHDEAKHLAFKIMSNRVQALLQMAQWKEAAKQGRQALHYEDCADNSMRVKLYTRLAKAMIFLPEYEEASRYLKRAQQLQPRSRDVVSLSELLAKRQRGDKRQEVEFAKRAMQRGPTQGSGDTAEGEATPTPAEQGASAEGREREEQQEETEIRVPDEFRAAVERTLRRFLDDPTRTEQALPLLYSEDGRHKLAHICVRCKQLGLKFITDDGRPRVVKP